MTGQRLSDTERYATLIEALESAGIKRCTCPPECRECWPVECECYSHDDRVVGGP